MKSVIQQKRNTLGLSQKELSELSGISFRTLQEYEQGRKKIFNASADVVYRLSQSLNCHMEDLLVELNENEQENLSSQPLLLYTTALLPPVTTGQVNIHIDDLVPCLKNSLTGEELPTAVFKIESRTFLSKFNSKNGWHINWSKVPSDVEVYAITTHNSIEIEGLIGLRREPSNKAVYIYWACTAPHNNIHEFGSQKYIGVGGHLFAIAIEKSYDYGFDGYVYGWANCQETLTHYVEKLGAVRHPFLHIYGFTISGKASEKLQEIYNYEWNNPS